MNPQAGQPRVFDWLAKAGARQNPVGSTPEAREVGKQS
jgi:hypothetical protein